MSEAYGIGPLDLSRFEDDPDRTLYVLDVRDPVEFRAGHRPGSRNAPGGQLVQAIQHPPAQLLQHRERQLHLRLDTLSASHPKVWRRLDRIAQQRGLTGPAPSTPRRSGHMPGAG